MEVTLLETFSGVNPKAAWTAISPLPKSEVELIVLILVAETKVSCLELANPEYEVLTALSPVLVPETVVVPVTAKLGMAEPERTTVLIEVAVAAPRLGVVNAGEMGGALRASFPFNF